jgi:hypothetical protein
MQSSLSSKGCLASTLDQPLISLDHVCTRTLSGPGATGPDGWAGQHHRSQNLQFTAGSHAGSRSLYQDQQVQQMMSQQSSPASCNTAQGFPPMNIFVHGATGRGPIPPASMCEASDSYAATSERLLRTGSLPPAIWPDGLTFQYSDPGASGVSLHCQPSFRSAFSATQAHSL